MPGIFLQPLIENAIKYGYQTSPTPLRLWIKVEVREDGGVDLEVRNTGEWVEPRETDSAHGNGLAILRRRLELLYHGRHRIDIASLPAGEVRIHIHLPTIDPISPRQ